MQSNPSLRARIVLLFIAFVFGLIIGAILLKKFVFYFWNAKAEFLVHMLRMNLGMKAIFTGVKCGALKTFTQTSSIFLFGCSFIL